MQVVFEPNGSFLPYRVGLVVVHLGLADLDCDVPPSCFANQPLLPNYCLPGLSWTDIGAVRIQVNPTHAHDYQAYPV